MNEFDGVLLFFVEMPPKKRNEWSQVAMAEALSAVRKGGMSIRLAAAKYGVPKSSLGDRISGRVREDAVNGKVSFLSSNDEKMLKETAEHRADLGIGYSKMNFFRAAGELTKNRELAFKRGVPSEKWWTLFKKRNNGPSLRMAEGTAEIRHKSMRPERVKMYFEVLKDVLENSRLLDKPVFIWNMDETLASLSPGSTKVLARTVFGPLKKEWRALTTTFRSETGLSVSHANFFRLFNKAWISISPEHLKNVAMAEALSAVRKGGMSIRLAAAKYGVPKSSLGDRISGRVREDAVNGKVSFLSSNDEKMLKETAEHRADLGRQENLPKTELAFKRGVPSEKWWTLFKKRNNGPSLRMAEGTAEIRHKSMRPERVKMYFEVLKDVLENSRLLDKPVFIWNMDETLASLSPGSTKVLARTVFGPLKKEWRALTTTFRSETGLSVSHANFFRLFNKAWISISPEHLKNATTEENEKHEKENFVEENGEKENSTTMLMQQNSRDEEQSICNTSPAMETKIASSMKKEMRKQDKHKQNDECKMPPKKRNEWSQVAMAEALSAVRKGGMSIRLAAAKYGVPKSSLGDRISGRVREDAVNGKVSFFSSNDEKMLKETAEHRADLGIGYSKMNFFRAAGELTKNRGLAFKRGVPSEKWWTLFKKRNNGPSLRMAEGTAEIRHKSMRPERVKMYFEVLKDVLENSRLLDKPVFIWNMDETLASLSPGSTKVLARFQNCTPKLEDVKNEIYQTVFGPLKKEWRALTTTFRSETGLSVSHANFFRLFNKAWISISPEHLKNATTEENDEKHEKENFVEENGEKENSTVTNMESNLDLLIQQGATLVDLGISISDKGTINNMDPMLSSSNSEDTMLMQQNSRDEEQSICNTSPAMETKIASSMKKEMRKQDKHVMRTIIT
ncbi:hypothetical protein KUTeg_024647 [Tegillarca granosa]|uniref:HTH psq-type domain-containing protein n=1 Tax=Tegillarca granosa TaxID=220873 RepID=A0ABQ9DXX9_TEGGR|nr:hypothetical protein KUTeg_024647 [Tegillarca granosa]